MTVWNKGLTKSDPRVLKYALSCSKTKLGKCAGERNPMYGVHRYGETSPHFGKAHTEETKKVLSAKKKEFYKTHPHPSKGKRRSDLATRNRLNAGKTYQQIYGVNAEAVKNKIGAAQLGSKSHFWRGGASFQKYTPNFTPRLKRQIRARDQHSCQICGVTTLTTREHVHHIDYDKKNTMPENLLLCCNSCHSKTNFNRRSWEDALTSFVSHKHSKYNEHWKILNKPTEATT